MTAELGLGPLSSATGRFAAYTEYALAKNPEDSKIHAILKADLISATYGLYVLAVLVEKVANFVMNTTITIVNSRIFQNILEKIVVAFIFHCNPPNPWACALNQQTDK